MFIAARMDDLVCDTWPAVHHVQRMASSHIGIQVQQCNLANHATALKSEARAGTYQAATTDNANLHWIHSLRIFLVLFCTLLGSDVHQ
jgi:hypothetical protein